MNTLNYRTPVADAEAVYEEKKSRFCAALTPVKDRDSALEFVERQRRRYAEARHHCWAYVVGDPHNADALAFNDAGEPSGTAGKPILSVVQARRIGDLCLVVSRYFGGIKLGAGGLIRAYASAAGRVLDASELVYPRRTVCVELRLPFAGERSLRHLLSRCGGLLHELSYSDAVVCRVEIDEQFYAELLSLLPQLGADLIGPRK